MIIKNNIKVSFDFDGTLDKPSVQKFAQDLLISDYDVYITTSRKEPKLAPSLSWNDDLFEISDSIGIKRKNIIFCNLEPKYKIIKNMDFIFHLDDCFTEINLLKEHTNIKTVCIFGNKYWKFDCQKLLDKNN